MALALQGKEEISTGILLSHSRSSFHFPSCPALLLRHFSGSDEMAFSPSVVFPVLLLDFEPFRAPEWACTDCELQWSWLNSSRCSSNGGMDILSWEKIKGIKVCSWKCPSSIYVLLYMFLLPFSSLYPYWSRLGFILKLSSPTTAFPV